MSVILKETEKDPHIDVTKRKQLPFQKFRSEVVAKQQEYVAKRLPFCSKCAFADAREFQHDSFRKRGLRKLKDGTEIWVEDEEPITIKDLDWYGSKDRFLLLNKAPIKEFKLLDGIRTMVETGEWHNFQCQERGCKISVETELLVKK